MQCPWVLSYVTVFLHIIIIYFCLHLYVIYVYFFPSFFGTLFGFKVALRSKLVFHACLSCALILMLLLLLWRIFNGIAKKKILFWTYSCFSFVVHQFQENN